MMKKIKKRKKEEDEDDAAEKDSYLIYRNQILTTWHHFDTSLLQTAHSTCDRCNSEPRPLSCPG